MNAHQKLAGVDQVTALRLLLKEQGFSPLPCEGKNPKPSAWPTLHITPDKEITAWATWYRNAINTGIICQRTPGYDIDISREPAARAVEERVRRWFEERGVMPVRFGRLPRRAFLLRTDEPFAKIKLEFKGTKALDNPTKNEAVEILCDGQQIIVDGVHPDTGKPYLWHGLQLGEFKRDDLPLVTRQELVALMGEIQKMLETEFAFAGAVLTGADDAGKHESNPAKTLSPKRLAAAVKVIPNDCDWDCWVRIGLAIYAACGGSNAGFDVFDKWSQKSPKYNAENTDKKWSDFRRTPPRDVGGATLIKLANESQPDWDLGVFFSTHQATEPEPEPAKEPEPEPNLDDRQQAVSYMNSCNAVVQLGGKMRIAYYEPSPVFKGCEVVVYSDRANFISLREKVRVKVKTEDGSAKTVGIGKWWLDQPDRRQYDRVVFDPTCSDPKAFNLWRGFSCELAPGDCSLYLDHLFQNICRGNKEHFTYLLDWMARCVQHPELQGEVATVLRGDEGTGKGVAITQFGRLFGPHFLQVSQASHLVGHFNSHLQSISVLFADEAFFAGDRRHEGVLKALVTEATIVIEIKGIDAFAARNSLSIMMSSNADWVVPAGSGARRFFCLDVSNAHKDDHAYFNKIVRQMDAGGLAALLHMLQARDLSKFNVRRFPVTDMLRDQQSYSRRGLEALAYALADSGTLPCSHLLRPHIAITDGESRGEGFVAEAMKLVPELNRMAGATIKRELRDKWGCRHWTSHGKNGIEFPPLDQLRSRFPLEPHWKEGDVWRPFGWPST